MNNSIRLVINPLHKNKNRLRLYIDSTEVVLLKEQKCGEIVRIKVVQEKAAYYNGNFLDYIISMFDRLNDHWVGDIIPPYNVIYECEVVTRQNTIVKINPLKAKKGFVEVVNGDLITEKKTEEISNKAYSLFKKILPVSYLSINIPIVLCSICSADYWWLPLVLFSFIYVPINIALTKYAIKTHLLRSNNRSRT